MAILRKIKALLSDRKKKEAQEREQSGPTEMPPAPQRERRKSITEQVKEIRTSTGVGEFTPSWRQQEEDPSVGEPGPLLAWNVKYRDDLIDITFEMDATHLVLNIREEQRICKIPYSCIYGIKVDGGELRLDLHVPVPLMIEGEMRAIRSLSAQIYDDSAGARWTWLGAKHYRSSGECPYCFKSALATAPTRSGAPQPMEDGKALTTATCLACHRQFRYDYEQGDFIETLAPEGESEGEGEGEDEDE